VLASLNHPNIAAIYGVEERALIMELIEGPTLAERLAQGAIAMAEALQIRKPDGRSARMCARTRHCSPRSNARQHQDYSPRPG
jgi:hypothetical protein